MFGVNRLLIGFIDSSNGGVFGSLYGTPIINLPQSAVLGKCLCCASRGPHNLTAPAATIGMHATKDRPVVVDGQIVIRPIMIVALTYDHRLLDGREAVTFLGEWDLSVVLVLPGEQPTDVMIVVVGTYSESEGVHRGPSQDALGITKLALRSFLSLFCCCEVRVTKRLKRRIVRKRRVGSVSWMLNCRTWFLVATRTLFFARLLRQGIHIQGIMVSFSFIVSRYNGPCTGMNGTMGWGGHLFAGVIRLGYPIATQSTGTSRRCSRHAGSFSK